MPHCGARSNALSDSRRVPPHVECRSAPANDRAHLRHARTRMYLSTFPRHGSGWSERDFDASGLSCLDSTSRLPTGGPEWRWVAQHDHLVLCPRTVDTWRASDPRRDRSAKYSECIARHTTRRQGGYSPLQAPRSGGRRTSNSANFLLAFQHLVSMAPHCATWWRDACSHPRIDQTKTPCMGLQGAVIYGIIITG